MKSPKLSIFAATLVAVAGGVLMEGTHPLWADIQDPPMVQHGPVRKLGRGLANIILCDSEVVSSFELINNQEGNSAAYYGLVRGIQRTLFRLGAGIYEVVTFPFPTTKGSFEPVLKRPIPWVSGGYEEFPPELGFETRFDYCRTQSSSTRMP
jgi:putative exosortase-associated protein (TIGR04073 family)